MTVFLPFALLAIVVVSVLLDRQKGALGYPSAIQGIVVVAVILAGDLAILKFASPNQTQPIWIATLVGVAFTAIAAVLDTWKPNGSALMALGAAGASVLLLLAPAQYDAILMAAPGAAAVTALILCNRSSALVALTIALSCVSAVMGAHTDTSFVYPSSGIILIGGIALVGVAGTALKRMAPGIDKVWPVLACGLAVAIAYAAAVKYLSLGAGWTALCIAPVAALVAYWLRDVSGENDVFGLLVSAAIWLGLATAAFGLSKAFGVALALVIASATLMMLDADRALIGAGPMLAVVLTQLFGTLHPDAARSVDVGQHYVLIGLAFGALLPLLPDEWIQRNPDAKAWREAAASGVWAIVICSAPVLIGIYLAPKGLVGFASGLGLGGFFGSLRPTMRLLVPALAAGTGCLACLEYGWMGGITDLARPDKIHWFLVSGICIAVVAAILGLLGMRSGKSVGTPESA